MEVLDFLAAADRTFRELEQRAAGALGRRYMVQHLTSEASEVAAAAARDLAGNLPALKEHAPGLAQQVVGSAWRLNERAGRLLGEPSVPAASRCPECAGLSVFVSPVNPDLAACLNRVCRRRWSQSAGEWTEQGWSAVSVVSAPLAGLEYEVPVAAAVPEQTAAGVPVPLRR